MTGESELALVEAAIGGDTDSFAQLAQRYYPAMVAIAHSVLGDRHIAEDAAQEALANKKIITVVITLIFSSFAFIGSPPFCKDLFI